MDWFDKEEVVGSSPTQPSMKWHMKWQLVQKIERILGHKIFWFIARKFNRWIDLTEYYGCRKKIDFKSEERAEQSAQKMNESGKARNELEHYQCQYCDGWHLGRKNGAIRLVAKSSR